MDRWCIISTSGDAVLNIIIWDGVTEYTPPEGTYLVPATDDVEIGWIYDSQNNDYFEFTAAP